MKRNTDIARLPAFTVFELTVVIAILSTLVMLIMFGFRRFNEQLKNAADISTQLNTWRMERAGMWKDFFTADSVHIQTDEVQLFRHTDRITYRAEEGRLFRKMNDLEEVAFSLPEASIVKVEQNGKVCAEFHFALNDVTPMTMTCYPLSSRKQEIDTYFNRLADE